MGDVVAIHLEPAPGSAAEIWTEDDDFSRTFDPASVAPGGDPVINVLAVTPNPAMEWFVVQLGLLKSAPLHLALFDVRGRNVKALSEGSLDAGLHSLRFDLTDHDGQPLAAGTYFVKAIHARGTRLTKLTIVR